MAKFYVRRCSDLNSDVIYINISGYRYLAYFLSLSDVHTQKSVGRKVLKYAVRNCVL